MICDRQKYRMTKRQEDTERERGREGERKRLKIFTCVCLLARNLADFNVPASTKIRYLRRNEYGESVAHLGTGFNIHCNF
jgi:hypothetical protein